MTELLFWETTIGKTPVSFALDIFPGLILGAQIEQRQWNGWNGWHDLTIYLGPLSLTFTVYGRGA